MNIHEHIAKTGRDDGFDTPPPKPTDYMPGSDDKLMTLVRRAEAGDGLFSDDDRLHFSEDED